MTANPHHARRIAAANAIAAVAFPPARATPPPVIDVTPDDLEAAADAAAVPVVAVTSGFLLAVIPLASGASLHLSAREPGPKRHAVVVGRALHRVRGGVVSEHTDPARDVEALASVLDRHVTDAAFESGCRLSCGYDGGDLTEHMAEAVLASDWLAADRARVRAEAIRRSAKSRDKIKAEEWRIFVEATGYDPDDPSEDDYGTCVREAIEQVRAEARRETLAEVEGFCRDSAGPPVAPGCVAFERRAQWLFAANTVRGLAEAGEDRG